MDQSIIIHLSYFLFYPFKLPVGCKNTVLYSNFYCISIMSHLIEGDAYNNKIHWKLRIIAAHLDHRYGS